MAENSAKPRALIDTDGENRAVRWFLAAYGSGHQTVGRMKAYLTYCGYPLWPAWVETEDPGEHLTKAGAQLWLRHLFSLENSPTVTGPVDPKWPFQSPADGRLTDCDMHDED